MPNWCFTQMIFHGEKEEINDFHKKIEEWTSKNFEENGFGVNWLGNVLHGAGLGHRIDSVTHGLRCRGDITFLGEVDTFKNSNEACFNLDTETAWCPMILMWSEVIKAMNYKTVNFSYMAEEPGCEIYQVYDPYGDFDEKYYIDVFVDSADEENKDLMRLYDSRYFSNDDELRNALQLFLKTEERDIESLIKLAEDYEFKSEDSYLYVHKYDYVDSITA